MGNFQTVGLKRADATSHFFYTILCLPHHAHRDFRTKKRELTNLQDDFQVIIFFKIVCSRKTKQDDPMIKPNRDFQVPNGTG